MNSDLEKINVWLRVNLLTLNVKKLNCIIFNHGSQPEDLPIVLDGQSLSRVDKIKNLGLHLSENICWKIHIEEVKKESTSNHSRPS